MHITSPRLIVFAWGFSVLATTLYQSFSRNCFWFPPCEFFDSVRSVATGGIEKFAAAAGERVETGFHQHFKSYAVSTEDRAYPSKDGLKRDFAGMALPHHASLYLWYADAQHSSRKTTAINSGGSGAGLRVSPFFQATGRCWRNCDPAPSPSPPQRLSNWFAKRTPPSPRPAAAGSLPLSFVPARGGIKIPRP